MSDIVGELARTREAFDKPTLTLLSRKWASITLSVFISMFTRDQEAISAERLHAQVETYLSELHAVGVETPSDPARILCRRWVDQQWLVLATSEDQIEVYSLTSHAQEAIDYVHRLSGARSMLSKSRITTILEAARRCALDANPDREQRIKRLNDQISKLTAERDRIAAGGEIAAAADDRMLEEYLNVRDLIAQLPADFMRVSESVKAIHREIIASFREEGRPTGEVLDAYLAKSDNLMSRSAEGRAFIGAVELLRDDRLLKELRDDLNTILAHPFSDVLRPSEAHEFRSTVSSINHNIGVVLDQRRRLSGTLRAHITRHDAVRDRELDDALRVAKKELARWMAGSGPRAKVPVSLGLPKLDVGHLQQRFYNPADHAPPPPLQDNSGVAAVPSAEELRMQGGPRLADLRNKLRDAMKDGEECTAGEVFADSPTSLKRPVEVLGYIHIASSVNALPPADAEVEEFETVRPDGSRRTLATARIAFRRDQVASLPDDHLRAT